MDFDLFFATASSATVGAGGFWLLMKYRQDRIEIEQKKTSEQMTDVRERLIRIETLLTANKDK